MSCASHCPMKTSDTPLVALRTAAALAILAGLAANLHSLSGLRPQVDLWRRKTAERQELQSLVRQSARFDSAIRIHESWPSAAPPLESLAKSNFTGRLPASWTVALQPGIPGWQSRRVVFSMTDVSADNVLRFMTAAASARPPWVLEECALQSSSASGTLSRVEMAFSSVERTER